MSEGKKYDEGKLMFSLVDPRFLTDMVIGLQEGYNKYGYKNYLKGLKKDRVISALYRHLIAYQLGEFGDRDGTSSHLGKVAVNAMMLFEIEKNNGEE